MARPDAAAELVEAQIDESAKKLSGLLKGDVIAYIAPIHNGGDELLRDALETIESKKGSLFVILHTDGGYIEVAERMVHVMRHHYPNRVEFIVPDSAMSAGTVLAASGDEIHMDYYSVLGPIDPQVENRDGGKFVPALGYLEQFRRFVDKAKRGKLTTAETTYFIERFDPADLYSYEQARALSISLLKEWLVKYKFKNWHRTETRKRTVTPAMRSRRAIEIAKKLNDTKLWGSHGRGICRDALERLVGLKIIDFAANATFNRPIRDYYKLLTSYVIKLGARGAIHVPGSFVPIGGNR
jgi:hypothetical protein